MGGKGSGTLGIGGKSGFLGAGTSSGLLGTGILGSGPQKIKGFDISPGMAQAEQDMIARQNAIASGQGPSIAQQQFNANMDQANRQALALAASQRGASNPALAFRNAQVLNQQNTLEGSQQAAILAEQERRQAEQLIAAQAAAQRGVAFQQANSNLNSTLANQNTQANFFAGLGSAAMGAAGGGGAKGIK